MLSTWIDAQRNIQIAQHDHASLNHSLEVEVSEDSTGIVTVYIRQIETDMDPVIVKMVGPGSNRNELLAPHERREVAAQRER